MRGGALNSSTTNWNINFGGFWKVRSCKLLIFWLSTFDAWDSQHLLISCCVKVKNFSYLGRSLFLCCMGSVTLLPQELSGSDEGSRMLEFPSNHIWPLIHHQGKVSMRMNPVFESWVHNSFRCRSESNWLLKIRRTCFSDPRNLRRKVSNMVLLSFQSVFTNKHWEIAVLDSNSFNFSIEEALNLLPDEEGSRSEDVAPWDVIVVNHLTFFDDVRVPFREVYFLFVLDWKLVDTFRFIHHVFFLSAHFRFFVLFRLILFFGVHLFLLFNKFFFDSTGWFSLTRKLGEIEDFVAGIVTTCELLKFKNTFARDSCTSCAIHRMETGPLCFSKLFVNNNLNLFVDIVNHWKVVDSSLDAPENGRQVFFRPTTEVFGF